MTSVLTLMGLTLSAPGAPSIPPSDRLRPWPSASPVSQTLVYDTPGGGARIALLWHFGSVLKNPPVAVRATIRNRRRSEQLGDDGAADLRQRWLRRRSVGHHLFSPAPPPSGAGVADKQRRCRSSRRGDADRSRSGPRSRRAQVPA